MRLSWLAFSALLTLVSTSSLSSATTIHVPDEQPTIQAGIDAASPGDTVLVACGTYYEHDIEMKSGVYLTSKTGQADCVTVDAQQQSRVLYCNGVDNLASIVGFTITGGLVDSIGMGDNKGGGMYCYSSSPTLRNCSFAGNRAINPYGCGGGMYCTDYSSPTLTDCTFSGNEANNDGGGVFCRYSSSPTLTNCTFSENRVTYFIGSGGGMICLQGTSPTLMGCTFSGNETDWTGGGLSCKIADATITDCTFSGNRVGYAGGGLYVLSGSVVITGCTFSENRATSSSGRGGGMHCESASPALDHCVFSGNEVMWGGGGLGSFYSSPALTDCTFSGNRATGPSARGGGIVIIDNPSITLNGCTIAGNETTHQGGALYCLYCSPTLTNCIIAFNQAGEFAVQCYNEEDTPLLACCNLYGNANGDWVGCIADQYAVDGNFSADPLFCDMYNDDFTLCANSPCLPDSNDCGVLIGAHGEGCPDCGSPVERTSWGSIKAMFR